MPVGSTRSRCSSQFLQRKVIANGSFASRDDLIAKLIGFVTDYDQTAKPFKWTYAAVPSSHESCAIHFRAAALVSPHGSS